jgi:hypothetical protein
LGNGGAPTGTIRALEPRPRFSVARLRAGPRIFASKWHKRAKILHAEIHRRTNRLDDD